MSNQFVHIELNTGDVSAAKKFYKKIFDSWQMHDEDMGEGMTYTMLSDGKSGIGGIALKMAPEAPSMWLPYVEVAEVEKTMAKAQKHGAKVIVPFMDMEEMGALGIFTDPTGATIGIWQAPKKGAAKAAKKAGQAEKKDAKKGAAKELKKGAKKDAKRSKK